jgi:hypothetical protein
MNGQVREYEKNLEEQFTKSAQEIEKANPSLRMELTNEQIKTLLELEKTTDFRIPESIAQKIKENNLDKYEK